MPKTTRPLSRVRPVRCSSAAGSAPGGSTFCESSTWPSPVDRPSRMWAGRPLTSLSATAKSSLRPGSTTGVPVMPTVGEIFPQGSGVGRGDGCPQVCGPVHGAGGGRQSVDGVVLRGHEDLPAEDDRRAIDVALQCRGSPGTSGNVDVPGGRGDTAAGRISVIEVPIRSRFCGHGGRPLVRKRVRSGCAAVEGQDDQGKSDTDGSNHSLGAPFRLSRPRRKRRPSLPRRRGRSRRRARSAPWRSQPESVPVGSLQEH